MAPTTNNTMASNVKKFIDPDAEFNMTAIQNQIISNLQIIRSGSMESFFITSAFEKNKDASDKTEGTWKAAVWNDRNHVIFATTEGTETVVAAMRKLLRLTSAKMKVELEEWKKETKATASLVKGGVEYI